MTVPQKPKRRFWLMKSEPSCFSIQDLKQSPKKITSWDGVRNYQARNLLRDEVKTGDGVLFYHSNIKEPAIVGLAKVVRDGYPDATARDPKSEHFDPKARPDNPIWYMVDIQYIADIDPPITREDLRYHPDLMDMDVLKKGNRLSVQPVTSKQWRAVLKLGGTSDPF
jgi:predicted RNA-binding protein with PUA-like domain